MFAFAIADFRGNSPELFLVRDRWGIKPLYFSWQDQKLGFASTPGALLDLPWIKKSIDKQSLAHFLRFAHFPQNESVYKDINQVLPGTYFHYKNSKLESKRYFHPSEIITNHSSDANNMDAVLESAVERQMVSDTEVGCFLSGGIDSSLLVSYASKLQPNLKTFSIGYAEKAFDETPYAEAVAKHFGTNHFSFKVGPQDLQKRVVDLPTHFDQPLGDPTILPTLFLAEYTSKEVKVVLSGDGADELFCGYPHQAALIKLKFFSRLPKLIRQALTPSILGKISTLMRFENESDWIENFIGILGPLDQKDLHKIILNNPPFQTVVGKILIEPEMKNIPWPQKIEQIYLRTFLTDTVLAKTDRAGMAYGLEARVPFLDDEVTQYAGNLAFKHKLNGLNSKTILRNLLQTKLPGNLHQRTKQGFSIPLRDWYRGAWKGWLEHTLDKDRLKLEGIFDGAEIAKIMAQHQSGKINHSHLLWCLMSFQLWHERQ
jgi:asparagine synthase (glutamine-hydrolysing)